MVLGADIGGSHITIAKVDLQNISEKVEVVAHQKVNAKGSEEEIFAAWEASFKKAIESLNGETLEGIGIAMPGPFNYQTGVSLMQNQDKFDALYNKNVKEELASRLGIEASKIRFANDAACFGMGEAFVGQLKSFKKSLAITLGTGFGSTFLDEGFPISEGDTVPNGGELWDEPCLDSIADACFSTRWFTTRYNQVTGKEIKGVKDLVDMPKGTPEVDQIFGEFAKNLAEFLTPWLQKFNGESVVVGGNIANAWSFFIDELNANFERLGIQPKMSMSTLQEQAALLGAARLVDDAYYNKLYK